MGCLSVIDGGWVVSGQYSFAQSPPGQYPPAKFPQMKSPWKIYPLTITLDIPPIDEISSTYRISPSTSRFKNKSKSNFLGGNVSKIVGSNISRTRNSAKIRDPNDAKFHRSAHYTVESLVPQSTISPDMLVKDPKL